MSWNGSDKATASPSPRKGPAKNAASRSAIEKSKNRSHVLLAGLILIALCGAAVWFITSRNTIHTVPEKHTKKQSPKIVIQESVVVTNKAKDNTTTEEYPPIKTYRDEKGILRYEGGARVPLPKHFVNPTRIVSKSILPKFKHPVESEIAALLTCKPGGVVAGVVRYDLFKQDFINSLVDKIEITADDSPRQKEIKEAVIEAKKELAERVKAGEDIAQILKDTRSELRRMSEYKFEIEKIVKEQLRDPNATEDDVKVAYEAANKMLEEKGIAPIRMNRLLLQRERLLNLRQQKETISTKK